MKEPDILPEDLDEWEADYYARKSSGGVIGCFALLGMVILIFAASIYNLIMRLL